MPALGVGFSVPTFAVETYYIMYDNSMKGCSVMTTKPTGSQYKMMGRSVAAAFGRRLLCFKEMSHDEISGRGCSDRWLRHSRLG